MRTKPVSLHEMAFAIPDYYSYSEEESKKHPEGAVYTSMQAHAYAYCLCLELAREDAWPQEEDRALETIKSLPGRDLGLLEAGVSRDFAYGIFKTPAPGTASEVNFTLVFQKYYGEKVLQIRAIFFEQGERGYRENTVFRERRERGLVGVGNDPYARWYLDTMNLPARRELMANAADLLEYDRRFPDSPLTLCRELAAALQEKKEEPGPEREEPEEPGETEE